MGQGHVHHMSVDAGSSQQQRLSSNAEQPQPACVKDFWRWCATTYSPCYPFTLTVQHTPFTLTIQYTHTKIDTYMCVLCNQSTPSKLLAQHEMWAMFCMPGPPADTGYPIFIPEDRRQRWGGWREGRMQTEVTEECDTKGHPLSAVHSVTARPQWPSNRTLQGPTHCKLCLLSQLPVSQVW